MDFEKFEAAAYEPFPVKDITVDTCTEAIAIIAGQFFAFVYNIILRIALLPSPHLPFPSDTPRQQRLIIRTPSGCFTLPKTQNDTKKQNTQRTTVREIVVRPVQSAPWARDGDWIPPYKLQAVLLSC